MILLREMCKDVGREENGERQERLVGELRVGNLRSLPLFLKYLLKYLRLGISLTGLGNISKNGKAPTASAPQQSSPEFLLCEQ